MLIFWEKRIVFLATPKAGSTAVEVALEPLSNLSVQRPAVLKHADATAYHRFIAPWLNSVCGEEFTTVALMREPINWLQSWYRFRLRDDEDTPDRPMREVNFDQFARDYTDPEPPAYAQVGSQTDFLSYSGARGVDRIFRYEDMAGFINFMEDRLNCAITLPRINVPPHVETPLSPATEAALRGKLAPDLQLYHEL